MNYRSLQISFAAAGALAAALAMNSPEAEAQIFGDSEDGSTSYNPSANSVRSEVSAGTSARRYGAGARDVSDAETDYRIRYLQELYAHLTNNGQLSPREVSPEEFIQDNWEAMEMPRLHQYTSDQITHLVKEALDDYLKGRVPDAGVGRLDTTTVADLSCGQLKDLEFRGASGVYSLSSQNASYSNSYAQGVGDNVLTEEEINAVRKYISQRGEQGLELLQLRKRNCEDSERWQQNHRPKCYHVEDVARMTTEDLWQILQAYEKSGLLNQGFDRDPAIFMAQVFIRNQYRFWSSLRQIPEDYNGVLLMQLGDGTEPQQIEREAAQAHLDYQFRGGLPAFSEKLLFGSNGSKPECRNLNKEQYNGHYRQQYGSGQLTAWSGTYRRLELIDRGDGVLTMKDTSYRETMAGRGGVVYYDNGPAYQ